jgi:hypothetical protein
MMMKCLLISVPSCETWLLLKYIEHHGSLQDAESDLSRNNVHVGKDEVTTYVVSPQCGYYNNDDAAVPKSYEMNLSRSAALSSSPDSHPQRVDPDPRALQEADLVPSG